jgi:hypothetical protein
MSFLVAAALAVGLFVILPIAAHLLRRGRVQERPFPPATLVPPARSTARERATIEDRALLSLRALAILCLAVIGAAPLVRCSRLTLTRSSGASVALALVLDDSHSMRARGSGETRFERATRAAKELLSSAREGDSIAIVLAGKPARLALSATTDLSAARRALGELRDSDRSTDLAAAVAIARTSLSGLAQRDRRVVLLSDLAGDEPPAGEPAISVPVPELANPLANCAIYRAERRGRRIDARVACSSAAAAEGRTLTLVSDRSSAPVPLAPRAGLQQLGLDVDPKLEHAEVALSGSDALESDDRAEVAAESTALGVLVVVDTTNGSAETGGAPILEQALTALANSALIHPLSLLPDDPSEYRGNSLVLLDDPLGITPEARGALSDFVAQGGVAVALLGPRVDQAPLGSTFEPFARGALHWQANATVSLNDRSLSWLGPEAASLRDLRLHGRAGLAAADLLGAKIVGKFADDQPFLTEREVGRGALLTCALPTSIERSDFPLRPAFLALLDHWLSLATTRRGVTQSVAGSEWLFPSGANVTIDGPRGPLVARDYLAPGGNRQKAFTPPLAGLYSLRIDDRRETRVATLEPSEITTLPRTAPGSAARARAAGNAGNVDASPELGLVALALLTLELGLRAFRNWGLRQRVTSAPALPSRAD